MVYHLDLAGKPIGYPKAFLNFSHLCVPASELDVHVVFTLMGHKAYIGAPVLKRYPPEAALEMVWIAVASGAEQVEVFTTPETAAAGKLLEAYGFKRRLTNVYRLLL